MCTYQDIKVQIEQLTTSLVKIGLSSDQNFPIMRTVGKDEHEIFFKGAHHITYALKNKYYQEIYDIFLNERAYNIKMLDGALIQIMYYFSGGLLSSHRLSFFPSPYLFEFQNYPEIYDEDEIYADIISKSIVKFPIRFDYDYSQDKHIEVDHPKSHLSLGQYKNCRIPVSSPITPYYFFQFILRNFYYTAHGRHCCELPIYNNTFENTMTEEEKRVVYIQIPDGLVR